MSLRKLLALPAAALALASLSACLEGESTFTQRCPVYTIPPVTGDTVTLTSGVRYIDAQVGTGTLVDAVSDTISFNYDGFLPDGTLFGQGADAALRPLSTAVPGFSAGVLGMKVGGIRRILIPAEQGYGATPPQGTCIPANSPLIFTVQLRSVNGQTGLPQ